jgi:phosphatidylserine/phosphatidylglycerophosphate/cardiolipin synthase-like enzyme
MIIDQRRVITGTFNFTKAAEEHNVDNLVVIDGDPELVAKYTANWKNHERHSTPYSKGLR